MQRKGSLSERNVLELLTESYYSKSSGLLQLHRRQFEKGILFRNGAIIRAQSNQDAEKLGQILLKKSLVTAWDLEIALTQSAEGKNRLGEVLVGMGVLKENVLIDTLAYQTKDIIFSMIDWEDGEYCFEPSEVTDQIVSEELYTAEVILQGMRRISNIVLLLRPLGDLQGTLRLSEDYLDRTRKVTLLTEEKSVLAMLQKPSSLKDLIKNSSMEKLTIYRSVAALLAIRVLVMEQKSTPVQVAASQNQSISSESFEALPVSTLKPVSRRKQIGEMLVEQGIISESQLKDALAQQSTVKGKKIHIGSILTQLGYANEDSIVNCLSLQMKIKAIHQIDIAEDVQKVIPFTLAKKYFVCPVRKVGTRLEVAMLDPTNMAALDDISFVTSLRIQPLITTAKALKDAWIKLYGQTDEKGVQRFDGKEEVVKRDIRYRSFVNDEEAAGEDDEEYAGEDIHAEDSDLFFDMGELENLVSGVVEDLQVLEGDMDAAQQAQTLNIAEAPIVRLVNSILRQAISSAASDIHIEPKETKLQVRFRLDGQLHKVMSLPVSISNALISRVKIISGMDIAEKRRPQDGRVKLRMGKKRAVDYRVSVVPTVFGERVVLRVLDRASLQIDLTKLGFDSNQLEAFKKVIKQPYGMILLTGPTGSGKTTTLYSALTTLDNNIFNIITAENPVEYNFPGISQVQINEGIGVTFASALRSFLRQDPDIIMVGEIRDTETAEICAKAALTGHLVFSTVHTNDAPSAIGRLVDLGLKPYLVSASLLMVVAQRLLRNICNKCRVPVHYDKKILIDAGFTEEEAETAQLFRGTGCEGCAGTTYFGRTGIFELMTISRRIKSAIAADLPADQIKDIAMSEGMKDLRRAAIEKVLVGVTTLEEAMHNTLAE